MLGFLDERSAGGHFTADMRAFSDRLDSHSLVNLQVSGGQLT